MENVGPHPKPERKLTEILVVQRLVHEMISENLGYADTGVPYKRELEIHEVEESIRIVEPDNL